MAAVQRTSQSLACQIGVIGALVTKGLYRVSDRERYPHDRTWYALPHGEDLADRVERNVEHCPVTSNGELLASDC